MPRANLLYSPRNKILATSLLIEAILYEEQTRRGVALAHYDEFGDVADHCTVCHKCEPACPVDIDFGDVSIIMRNYLRAVRDKILATSLLTRRSLRGADARGVARAYDEFGDVADHCTRVPQVRAGARWTSTSATCRSRCATCGARASAASTGTVARCCSSTSPIRAR